ncbi:PilW family protein [Massilia horti]|uniref:Prepilin-type N-terminal cleavage/methylation domain-containing protein n=1 Tax=Massilia horti TaxID=2562153 RepID=A0A4Y9T284_9BURK|nr:PilW family protein [Massilia horti]TFW33150.1 prepilin-type N-terminal cleavage/methylation domain-containing protein [Massilia horti]
MRTSFPTRLRAARGFSIPELLVAVAIGLVILAGMSTLFVKNTRIQGEIEQANRQVENGRYAIDLLAVDLRNAGYFAEFDPTVLDNPAALPSPCTRDLDELKAGLTLPVQGLDNIAAGLDCLPDVRRDTDVLVVRRTNTCVAGAPGCDPISAGGPFFQASLCNNDSELDSPVRANFYALTLANIGLNRHQRDCTAVAGSGTLAAIRRYRTHIYFIANNNKPGDGIPTLKRAELGSDGGAATYTVVPLAEGIENLQLEYGLDVTPVNRGDGVADVFSADPAGVNGCNTPACAVANWRTVVAVKVNLLARNTQQTQGWTDTKSYKLGQDAAGNEITIPAANDQYKRHVFQSQVSLPNPAGRRLP